MCLSPSAEARRPVSDKTHGEVHHVRGRVPRGIWADRINGSHLENVSRAQAFALPPVVAGVSAERCLETETLRPRFALGETSKARVVVPSLMVASVFITSKKVAGMHPKFCV